jgi:hypothetical protein
MIRKALLALAFGLAASCAYAQAPSPADVGISKGTPDVFKLKGHDNVWTPFGSIDPSTHIFVPGTNGSIAPNDCVKWGPGLTSAGEACNSVTGGATPANQLTIYTSHAGLVNNVTTPTEAWTVQQQGFYAPGDGGDATYQWSFTSYCVGGTSIAPATADGVGCVLPAGQSPSVAGRYLLSINGSLDVRKVGIMPGGQDNLPNVQTLMNAVGPTSGQTGTLEVVFPSVPGQLQTNYYFSKPFVLSRNVNLSCKSSTVAGRGAVVLVFPPGVDGVLAESGYFSPDGGWGQSAISGCQITSLGSGSAQSTMGSDTITNVGLNSTISMPLPASCDPVGASCTFGVGDGIIAMGNWIPTNGALAVAPGAYVETSNPTAHSLTLAPPYVIGTLTGGAPTMNVWDLPVSLKYTIQTTAGSNSMVVTAGPKPLAVGDMLWTEAFLFGSSVNTVDNTTAFPQTVTLDNVTLTFPENALAGKTGTYQMWTLPTALKRRVGGTTHDDIMNYFAIGMDDICQAGTSPPTGCNNNLDEHDQYWYSLVGRLVRGDNSANGTVIGSVGAHNTIADTVEAGTLGSSYLSEEYNSQDGGTSLYGVLVYCGTQNYSVFIGTYLSGQEHGPCMGLDAQGAPNIGVAADDTGVPSELFISSSYGYSNISSQSFSGRWAFSGPDSARMTTTIMSSSGQNVVTVPVANTFYPGMNVTDLTHPVIPTGTTLTAFTSGGVIVSNALTGDVQVGDQIQFQNINVNRGGPCISVVPGQASGANGMYFDVNCANHGLGIVYNGILGGWSINNIFMPDDNYAGYTAGGGRLPVLKGGLQLGDFSGDYNGMERVFDSGLGAPGEPWRLQGDTRINQRPTPGGTMAWTNAPSFTTTLAGAVTGGSTTSVAVAACPSPALPAGTPIADTTNASPNPNVNLSRTLGTLNNCTGATLTLQAAATNSGASGDTIQFLQWYPAAEIANDPGGTSWPLGTPTTIAKLAGCTPKTIGFGVVKNGAAGKADDDEVGKEGSSVRPVFCNGEKWTYLGGGVH